MSVHPLEPDENRRGFLKALALVTAAAAAGGGAAAVLRKPGETVITTVEPIPPSLPTPVASNVTSVKNGELAARLAASQAENLRLQAELAAARGRVGDLEATRGDAGREIETLRAELAGSNDQIGLLGGLVALYEQLDELDIDGMVSNGVNTMSEAFTDLSDRVPSLEEGLAIGAAALDNLENEIPFVQAGRDWAAERATQLERFSQNAETVLASALDSAGDFLELIGRWFQDVLKWVPFGMGDKAATVVESVTGLLQETPGTIEGLNRNVAEPLNVWLEGDGDELALRRKLVKPMREQALAPAGEVAGKVRHTHQTFLTALSEPVQETTVRRQAVRDLIARYRENYQV